MSTSRAPADEAEIRVLAIDDNPIFRAAIRRFFDRHDGFALLDTLADGQAAATFPLHPPPHIVLLDVHLASQLSLDVIQALRHKWSACKIIVLTFDDLPGYREAALRAGADEFVSKLSLASDLIPAMIKTMQARPSGGKRDDHADEQR